MKPTPTPNPTAAMILAALISFFVFIVLPLAFIAAILWMVKYFFFS